MPNLSIKYGESITAVYSDNFSEKEKHNLKKNFFWFICLVKNEEEIDFYTAFLVEDQYIFVIFWIVYKKY